MNTMSDENSDFDALKFLMDCGFKEASLFWNRNSVFLLANLASFSAAFAYVSSNTGITLGVKFIMSSFGVALCLVWWKVIAAGRHMNHTWTEQAKKVAFKIGHPEIENALAGTPSNAVSKRGPRSATELMYPLTIIFATAWVLISLTGLDIL